MASKLSEIFGNPFISPIGQKIEQATDGLLPCESWDLNIEICDMINETEDGPKDAVKAIRKRLAQGGKNATVILYTLTVLETCVKNCGRRFHVLVCSRDFLQDLIKVIGPKNEPPVAVQEKVLSLIQSWADAFRNIPELNAVVQFYQELRQKVDFPMTDLDSMPPIHTPQRSLPEEPAAPPAVGNSVHGDTPSPESCSPTPEQISKILSDLQVVEGNMTVLSEMLSELTPGNEHPSDLQLLQELHATCQEMQQRLVQLINQLSNDDVTGELLRVNDGLNNLFIRYNRYEKKRVGSKETTQPSDLMIDLGNDEVAASGGAGATALVTDLANLSLSSQLNSIPIVTADNTRTDEFDMFAQSRKSTYQNTKTGGSSYEANREPLLSTGLAVSAQTRGQVVHSESDFDEMAQWLGEKPGEEAISSSEFERFLAERAAAAEVPPDTSSSGARKPAKSPDDSMFSL